MLEAWTLDGMLCEGVSALGWADLWLDCDGVLT